MAFPTQTTQQSLQAALESAQNLALKIKTQATSWSSLLASNNVTGLSIVQRLNRMIEFRNAMNDIIAVPGLGAYANQELGISTAAADFLAIRDQLQVVMAWIGANLPQASGPGDYVAIIEIALAGEPITHRAFTPAQTAGLRTELDALAALID